MNTTTAAVAPSATSSSVRPTAESKAPAMAGRPRWSIAVMCYNECESLEPMVQRTLATLRGLRGPFEILIVNDGSSDGSAEIADRLAAAHPEVRVCHHSTNLGIGHVLIDGYRLTRGEITAILPADLQFAPEDLPTALAGLENADVVNVRRPDRKDPFPRKVVSFIDETLVGLLFGVRIRDLHWVKLYRRHVLDTICADIRSQTPMVDTELLIKAHRMGARMAEVSLPHHPRTAGRSTGATLSRIVKTFLDLLRLRWRL